MVDEKEEHYEEEGEYHFSDDQVNYEVEPEAPKATPTPAFSKEALLAKFTQHRRGILGAMSLFILMGVVYKILMPSSAPTSTEFSQATATAPVKTVKPVAAKITTAASQNASPPIQTPSTAPAPVVESKPAPAVMQQNQPPVATVAVVKPTPSVNPPVAVQQPGAVMPSSQAIAAPQSIMPVAPVQPQATATDVQTKDRITALEQQNTAMMNLLQNEYAQKLADAETQANATRGKMEELAKRVNHMETSLNQITELLQGMSKSQATGMGSASVSASNVATRPTEPKMIYTVQAIIPGRAWLKSESGDTVTVAEGDYLKTYGRVTKIDPYDGIVAIDTGNKVITLSYGAGSD